MPLLGRTRIPGLLLSTGHYRNGILLAPISAEIVRAAVLDSARQSRSRHLGRSVEVWGATIERARFELRVGFGQWEVARGASWQPRLPDGITRARAGRETKK